MRAAWRGRSRPPCLPGRDHRDLAQCETFSGHPGVLGWGWRFGRGPRTPTRSQRCRSLVDGEPVAPAIGIPTRRAPGPRGTLCVCGGVQHEGVGVQKSQSRESDGAALGCRGQGDRGGSVFEETAAGRGGASPGPLDSATRATRPVCAYAREVALAGHHATGGLGGATFRALRARDGTRHTEGAQSPGAEGQRPPGPCWPRGGGEDGSGRAAASGVVTRRRPPSAAHMQLPPGRAVVPGPGHGVW